MRLTHFLTGQTVNTEPWQDALKVGDFYVIEKPTLWAGGEFFPDLPPVYGQIISDEACEPGFFWAEAYSQMCPEGETGEFCIVEASRQLTEAEFRAYEAKAWPSSL
jgi:hypothetical protein